MGDALLLLVFSVIEWFVADPFPRKGEKFQTWWAAKSFWRKVRIVFGWMFLAFVAACLVALVILAFVTFVSSL